MARSLNPSQLPSYDICCISKSELGIRLFGQMILGPEAAARAQSAGFRDGCHVECDEDGLSPRGVDDLGTSYGSSTTSDDDDNPSCAIDEVKGNCELLDSSKKNEEGDDTIHPEEDTVRKPDKLIPCPRCDSLETKFCYFNNYNVNQPRHFCKHCQRYWTAGGNLRNVPVGAGKRKSKQSIALQRQNAYSPPSVLYRRDYPGDAEPLLSSARPTQREHITSVFSSPFAAAQLTTSVVENAPTGSSFSTTLRHPTPCVGSVQGVSGDARGTQWLKGTRDAARDLEVPLNLLNSHKETNCKEMGSSLPVPAALMDGVCDFSSQRSSCNEAVPSCAVPETWCSAPVLPVWPCLYWTGVPPIRKLLACPSARDALWKWGQCPAATPVWTPQAWTFPCANFQPWSISHGEPIRASVNSMGSSTALGKRPAEESLEKLSSLGTPKTLNILDAEAAARSSILTTLDGDTKLQSSTSCGFFNALQTDPGSWKMESEHRSDKEALRIGHTNSAARSRSHAFQQTA